jgi:type VI secretion system protein ImpA
MEIINSLDLPTLLAPIPGPSPGGVNTSYEVRDQLEQLRKEVDPESFAKDDPLRPTEFKKADWPGIIKLGSQTLIQTSKDLLIGARIVEAMTRTLGFKGLGDSLELMEGLIDQAWDRLVPVIEDPSDLDIRSAPFEWLDDADRGARFPSTIGGITLVDATKETPEMGMLQWKQGQAGGAQAGVATLDKVLAGTSLEKMTERHAYVVRCRDILGRIVTKLSEKLKDLAPSMVQVRSILDQCEALLGQMIARKAPVSTGGSGAAEANDGQAGAGASMPVASRDQAYQMMTKAADILSAIEPHSPVPYLIRRAVQIGGLPFPEMIQAFIREQNVIETMFRELGITKKP